MNQTSIPGQTCYRCGVRHRLRPRRAVRSLPLTPALAAALLFGLTGCGRRATPADCRLIVDKSVELQMKQMSLTDPNAIRKRAEEVTSALQTELGDCEGRRVTAATMSCVERAATQSELDACLR